MWILGSSATPSFGGNFVLQRDDNKEVARQLGIAMGTVRNHISDILRKLDARDRTHAVLKAIAGNMLSSATTHSRDQ
jgi:hypothetical protein